MKTGALLVMLLLAPSYARATNFWAMRILGVRDAREGWEYLDRTTQRAYREMNEWDVRSRVDHGRRIARLYAPWIVKTMIAIEHSGSDEYRPDVATPIIRVLRTFAHEGEDAFVRERSGAGAVAMAQFMPASYRLVRGMYPNARLPDFDACMRDHACQIRAMLCHFDAGRVPLPWRVRRSLERSQLRFALNIAAAYNAGGDRATYAVRRYPGTWYTRGRGLPYETQDYLWKFRRAHLPIYALEASRRPPRRVRAR